MPSRMQPLPPVGGAYAAAGLLQDADVGDIVSEIHYLGGLQPVPLAEGGELFPFVTAVQVYVFGVYSAGNHTLAYAFGASSGDDGHGETVHSGHADGESVLGVVSTKEVSVHVAENATVGGHAVYIKGKGPDALQIHFSI